jgi:hypothetical protein
MMAYLSSFYGTVEYKERGGDYFDRINSEQTKIKLIRRLERLGYEVDLKPKQATVRDRLARRRQLKIN